MYQVVVKAQVAWHHRKTRSLGSIQGRISYNGIMTQMLASQKKSDDELEEKCIRLEQEEKEREEHMKKAEMDFQLKMMPMITQSINPHMSSYPYPCEVDIW